MIKSESEKVVWYTLYTENSLYLILEYRREGGKESITIEAVPDLRTEKYEEKAVENRISFESSANRLIIPIEKLEEILSQEAVEEIANRRDELPQEIKNCLWGLPKRRTRLF